MKHCIHTLGNFVGNTLRNVIYTVYMPVDLPTFWLRGAHTSSEEPAQDHDLLTHMAEGGVNTGPLYYPLQLTSF